MKYKMNNVKAYVAMAKKMIRRLSHNASNNKPQDNAREDLIIGIVVMLHVLYNDEFDANAPTIKEIINEAINATNAPFWVDDEFESEFVDFVQLVLVAVNRHFRKKHSFTDIEKKVDNGLLQAAVDEQLLLDLISNKDGKFKNDLGTGNVIICTAWLVNSIKPNSWLHSYREIMQLCDQVIKMIGGNADERLQSDIQKYVCPALKVIYDAESFKYDELLAKINAGRSERPGRARWGTENSRAYAVLTQSLLSNEEHRESQRAALEDHHDFLHSQNKKLIKKHLLIIRSMLIIAVSVIGLGAFYFRFLLDEAKQEYYDRKHEETKKEQVKQTLELFNNMWAWQRSIKDTDLIYEVFRGRKNIKTDTFVRNHIKGRGEIVGPKWDDSLAQFFKDNEPAIASNININTYMNYMEVWKMYDESDQIDAHTAANNLPFFALKNDKLRYLYVLRKRREFDSTSQKQGRRCECGKVFDGYDFIFKKYLKIPVNSTEPFFHGRERG